MRLLRHARLDWARLVLLVALPLVGAVLSALQPWPLKLLVDHVLSGGALPHEVRWLENLPGAGAASTLIAWLALGTVVLMFTGELVNGLRRYLEAGAGGRMTAELGERVFAHLASLSLRTHRAPSSGDLVRRMIVDCSCVRDLIGNVVIPALSSLAIFAAMAAVMWHLDPLLTAMSALALLPLGLAIRAHQAPLTERSDAREEREGEVMGVAEQTLSALPVVQAFGGEAASDRRFSEVALATVRAGLSSLATQLRLRISVDVITAGITGLIMGLGGLRVVAGELSVGGLLVFLAYLGSFYGPLATLALLTEPYAQAAARAARVLAILDRQPLIQHLPRDISGALIRRSGTLRLEAVSFGYDPAQPVLNEISFAVAPGEIVAIVGPSGAGKSTIAYLIARLLDPDRGRITFDGRDVRDFGCAMWRRTVAIVFQDPFILPETIAANIALGRPGASRAAIVAATRAAGAHGFVSALPQGYDTLLGERGIALSGGEKQRLTIARALLKDAPVVVLDEPTSALDTETEAAVIAGIRQLSHGRATIVIAHRLTTVIGADRIVVLDEGRVAEAGSFEQLMAARGAFFGLYTRQFAAVSERVAS